MQMLDVAGVLGAAVDDAHQGISMDVGLGVPRHIASTLDCRHLLGKSHQRLAINALDSTSLTRKLPHSLSDGWQCTG
eukprot:7859875-Prorocentrum_lima.AAC.1